MIKRFYFDVETSGLDKAKCAILQLAAIVEIDDEIVDELNLFIKPFTDDIVDPGATAIHGLDPDNDIRFVEPQIGYNKLMEVLDRHVNKYDSRDKMYMVGYNCQEFDKAFLYNFMLKNGNRYMYSYFYPETLDLFVLLGYAAQPQRHLLGDFKLTTVAKSLGLEVAQEKAHDAVYDLELTYNLFKQFQKEYPT